MAQNKPVDGQGMVVDFAPTVRLIEAKLTADIDSLKAVLARSGSSLRDFAEHNRLLAEIQASIRAIDVLSGRTNLIGHPSHAGLAAVELASAPAASHDKDAAELSAMAKKLAPKPASA
ncbi:MAG TPA: hypothetical protein VIE66_15755 [Methylocella sp.]|jgi:hypothetical protein